MYTFVCLLLSMKSLTKFLHSFSPPRNTPKRCLLSSASRQGKFPQLVIKASVYHRYKTSGSFKFRISHCFRWRSNYGKRSLIAPCPIKRRKSNLENSLTKHIGAEAKKIERDWSYSMHHEWLHTLKNFKFTPSKSEIDTTQWRNRL